MIYFTCLCLFVFLITSGNSYFHQETFHGSDERNVHRNHKGSHRQGTLYAQLTGDRLLFIINSNVLCICFLVHPCILSQVHVCLQLSSEITDAIHEETISGFIRETANSVLTEELNKKRCAVTKECFLFLVFFSIT